MRALVRHVHVAPRFQEAYQTLIAPSPRSSSRPTDQRNATRLALSSLFLAEAKDTPVTESMAPAWPWPSCKVPRTSSPSSHSAALPGPRTIASIFHDPSESSSFTTSSAQPNCSSDTASTASEPSAAGDSTADDAVGRAIRSDRLLFDPPPPGTSATSSILEEKASSGATTGDEEAFVGGVAVAFESADPYEDFRTSMDEMVAAHGVRDWGWLEEMLVWFLRANDPDTHCAIVAAFIDVVVAVVDPAAEARSSGRTSSRTFPAVEFEAAEKSKARPLTA